MTAGMEDENAQKGPASSFAPGATEDELEDKRFGPSFARRATEDKRVGHFGRPEAMGNKSGVA